MRLVVRGKVEPEEMVIRKPTRFIPQIKQKVEERKPRQNQRRKTQT